MDSIYMSPIIININAIILWSDQTPFHCDSEVCTVNKSRPVEHIRTNPLTYEYCDNSNGMHTPNDGIIADVQINSEEGDMEISITDLLLDYVNEVHFEIHIYTTALKVHK